MKIPELDFRVLYVVLAAAIIASVYALYQDSSTGNLESDIVVAEESELVKKTQSSLTTGNK